MTFRVRALAKLAGISAEGDAADVYLDALVALQERGQLDSPEVQKHAGALARSCTQAVTWDEERHKRAERDERINRIATSAARSAASTVTAADFDANPWDELRDEFEEFIDEIEPEEEADGR